MGLGPPTRGLWCIRIKMSWLGKGLGIQRAERAPVCKLAILSVLGGVREVGRQSGLRRTDSLKYMSTPFSARATSWVFTLHAVDLALILGIPYSPSSTTRTES